MGAILNNPGNRARLPSVKIALLTLAALLLPLPSSIHADEPANLSFIRVDEDDQAARLQTAVTRYEKDGVSVELVGAIHIADKAYYESLNRRFEGYDALLFEMVGGEGLGRAATAKAKPEGPGRAEPDGDQPANEKKPANEQKPGQSALHQVYRMAAAVLGLVGQTEHIDYRKPNFVHADLTLREFEKLQAERGESLLGFALKNSGAGEGGGARQPDPAKLVEAMLKGKPNLLKLELVHTLGGAEDQISGMTGESVILTDRNARCMEVLERELDRGGKNLGVFYGAAHFQDIAKRLEEMGFKRSNQEWLTAWNIPKPEPQGAGMPQNDDRDAPPVQEDREAA